jgi:uncharacterized protein (UPF0548 family)
MIRFREPLTADIRDFLNNNAMTAFSYPDLGCTRGRNVAGFNTDRFRIELGTGDVTFEKARRAMRDWRGFSTDWVRLCWPYKKIVPGTVVAVMAHHYGLYSVNAARLVYVVDEPRRYGYALGSLTAHIVRGELLLVTYQEDDGRVFYELTAITRPGHWLSWVFYPLGRQLQNRFARDSLHALLESLLAQDAPRRSGSTAESEG